MASRRIHRPATLVHWPSRALGGLDIADGIDVRHAGLAVVIDMKNAAIGEFEPGSFSSDTGVAKRPAAEQFFGEFAAVVSSRDDASAIGVKWASTMTVLPFEATVTARIAKSSTKRLVRSWSKAQGLGYCRSW